jgi:hypothetical protein
MVFFGGNLDKITQVQTNLNDKPSEKQFHGAIQQGGARDGAAP